GGDHFERVIVGVTEHQAVELVGDGAAAELAGGALAARLDVEEPRRHVGQFDRTRGVVVHGETTRPQPRADRPHALIADWRVELIRGDHRVQLYTPHSYEGMDSTG